MEGGGAFEVDFKNPPLSKNEYGYPSTMGGDTTVTAYGGHGNRAYIAFVIGHKNKFVVSGKAWQ